MKIKSGYMKTETFDGWAVVPVEEESKRRKIMLTLNKTAAEIWDYLEEGKIPEEIVKGLSEKYGIPAEQAQRGVDRIVASLLKEGILEK